MKQNTGISEIVTREQALHEKIEGQFYLRMEKQMSEIIISILALLISIFSLILSFIQCRDKSFNIQHIQIKPLKNPIELLFNGNDEFSIDLINFNNRDILIYLRYGYMCINGKTYPVQSNYYTINANSVTKLEAKFSTDDLYPFPQKYDIMLIFEYKGLLLNRTFRYKRKAAEKHS